MLGITLAVTSALLIRTHELLGIILSFSFIIAITLFLKWESDLRFAVFGSSLFVLFKLFSLFLVDPITGPDSERYFAQVENFNSLGTFIQFAIQDIQMHGIMGVTSYTFFGLFYMPFYFF